MTQGYGTGIRKIRGIILLLLTAIYSFQTGAFGKSPAPSRLRLEGKTVSIGKFFMAIESQTRYYVVFSQTQVSPDSTVTFSRKEGPLKDFIDEFSRLEGLKYELSRKHIIFSKYVPLRLIKGRILGHDGSPVHGADVMGPAGGGRREWTVSRADGTFEILSREGEDIQISCLGYRKAEVKAEDGLSIVLEDDISELDESVVVGYGSQRKADLTGAISSVKPAVFKDITAYSVADAIQGQVAGVYVNRGRGVGAGSDIFIRGAGSVNGLKPLYVIDGMPGGGEVGLNLGDIESIEVIKDASAAAIYGANAAGGVILITTKDGWSSGSSVTFSAKTGLSSAGRQYKLLDTPSYIAARIEATGTYDLLWDNPDELPDTDWAKELNMGGTGMEMQYSLSLGEHEGKFDYYLSGSWAGEQGLQDDYWRKWSLLAKVDLAISPRLSIGTRISASKTSRNDNVIAWWALWRSIPYMTVYDNDGSFSSVPSSSPFTACRNYVAELSYGDHQRKGSTKVEPRLLLDWRVTDALKFNMTSMAVLGSSYSDVYQEQTYTRRTNVSDHLMMQDSHSEAYRFFSTLTYEKTFPGGHDINLMAGCEAWYSMSNQVIAEGSYSSVSDPLSMSMTRENSRTGDAVLDLNGRGLSQFARANWSLKDRYLLTVNVRRDGSSKFGPGNRFGIFPSASLGWKVSEEPFFRGLGANWISLLKPRVSYGVLGNTDALDDYSWQAAYSSGIGSYSFDGTASGRESGFSMNKVINREIKWEEITTTDAGVDAVLFDGRLDLCFDAYSRQSRDMLYNMRVPSTSGVSGTMPINLGSISNKGVEFSFSWKDRIGGFHWSVSANMAHNVNRVINLGESNANISAGDLGTTNENSTITTGHGTHYTVNGHVLGGIWGFKVDGLIQDEAELEELNRKARSGGFDWYQTRETSAGDLRYSDLNGDGHISKEDATFIGSPWPDLQFGGRLAAGWKNFDLSLSFTGVYGRDVVNSNKAFEYTFQTDYQTTWKIFDTSFMAGNGLTAYPRAYGRSGDNVILDPNGNWNTMSEFLVEDGSYLKVREIVLGYTLPSGLARKAGMERCRIYFSGDNLLTFTRFTGLDPEFGGGVTSYGLYREGIPMMRVFTFGLDVVFARRR